MRELSRFFAVVTEFIGTFNNCVESGVSFSRWTILVLRTVVLAAAAFAVGWLGSVKLNDNPASQTALTPPQARKNPTLSPAALADAEAGFTKIFHAARLASELHSPLEGYLDTLDATTVRALLDDLLAKPRTTENREMLFALARRFGDADPAAAINWLQGIPDSNLHEMCAVNIFDAYSANDPQTAFNTLAKLPKDPHLKGAAAFVVMNFAGQDPAAAWTALQALSAEAPNGQDLAGFTFAAFEQWALQDPATAAAEVLKLPPGNRNNLAIDNVAKSWARLDPAAAAAWLNTLPAGSRNEAINAVIGGLTGDDKPNVVAFINSLPDGPNNDYFRQQMQTASNDNFRQNIASSWSETDPAGLLDWANHNLTGKAYDTAAVAALKQLANTHPDSVATFLIDAPDINVVTEIYPALATSWAQTNPQAALAWAQSLPSDNATLRNAALAGVSKGWVATDPAAAAAYVQQNLSGSLDSNILVSDVASAWASTDPMAALKWAENLPTEPQNRAVVAALTQLEKIDAQIAAKTAQAELSKLTRLTNTQLAKLQNIAQFSKQ